jgi:hypothetical protein
MRLNTNSMSKLFDLMMMSFKFQLLRIKFPEELFQITMTHLNELVNILEKVDPIYNKDILEIVRENIEYVNNVKLFYIDIWSII